ncbi:HNH endonuclease [Devosia riboflavina]|uniref:HNH endonuclease n=1 Tax=Devosia riboflavina TaxID=46914 RepID=UPI00068B4B26|nr:HNH endonuclease signature motif containing protein [Devosia riboflavina]
MPRHNFSAKVKRQAHERSGGHCEAVGEVYGLPPGQRCNAALAGKRVEIDHYPIPATDEGSDVLENAVACCTKCHGHKTATYDVPMQAKGKRVATRHLGISQPGTLPGARIKYSRARGVWVDRATGQIVEAPQQ